MSTAGRLAFRVEGEFWNAYWAPEQHSMEKAVLLGSIRMSLAERSPTVKNGFMTLMKDAFGIVAQQEFGQTPTWSKPKAAPESDRSGNA